MFRFLLIIACLAVPVFSNSAGAPKKICENNLVPEHHVEPQATMVPYGLSGASAVKSGEKLSLTLGGDEFLGYAIQARDANDIPIGQFKIVQNDISQPLSCLNADDTLTHRKIPRDHPIKQVKFDWVPPNGYSGKVKFVATVAKDGGTYWIRKVVKDVNVQ